MPRAGLTGDEAVASAVGLADEIGYSGVTMGLLADRLGVRTPSLYKHVDGLADLQHRLAILATNELGEVIRDAVQGKAGRDALAALLTAVRAGPGREVQHRPGSRRHKPVQRLRRRCRAVLVVLRCH
ncbi:MAG: TetR/AcrR family transcriptional regulator [Streptosporangiaceae bacterium]